MHFFCTFFFIHLILLQQRVLSSRDLIAIAQNKGIVPFAEASKISIGSKAVRLNWPVLPDCWRSVELEEIPIGICTVWTLTALPDHLLILLAFYDAQQV